jgi:hypothetical protein
MKKLTSAVAVAEVLLTIGLVVWDELRCSTDDL